MKTFLNELRRRNVTRTAIGYTAAAWLSIEVADTILPQFGFSDTAVRNVIILFSIGFMPALVLSWFFELTPEGLKRELEGQAAEGAVSPDSKKTDRLIVLMLVAALGILAVDRFILDPARDSEEIQKAVELARTDAAIEELGDRSIAVLAFADMSPARDQAYFSDGIAEELLNILATVKELRVISRSSAFSFKESNATIPEIAEKLGVRYILEGSVRKAGGRVRVTAQLIDAVTDAHVWSESFDRDLDDIFSIQDEISQNIAGKLRVTLLDAGPDAGEISRVAYEKFLRAQYIVHTANESQLGYAQQLLGEVLDASPNYIPAINALARSYYRRPREPSMTFQENEAEIRSLANRVVEIDPENISAHIWKGFFANRDGDKEQAARMYERAIAIDSNNTSLLRVLVPFLMVIGREEEAVELGTALIKRDPACTQCVNSLALALRAAGRPEEAVATMRSIIAWHGESPEVSWSLGVSLLSAGVPDQALATFDRSATGGTREMGSIMALHDMGEMAEFELRFSRFKQQPGHTEAVARIYAWIGKNDLAFEWIDKMVDQDGPQTLGFIDTELYDKIKTDPRWSQIRTRHGFGDSRGTPIDFNYDLGSEDAMTMN